MAINSSFVLIFIGYIVTLGMSAPTTRAPDLINQAHEALVRETGSLLLETQLVLDRYKEERLHMSDIEQNIQRMEIVGLPTASRLSASEGDCMQTRIDDLNVFLDLLQFIEDDERVLYREDPKNFVDELQELRVGFQRVINKAQSVMETENLNGTSQTTYPELIYNNITSKVFLQFYTIKTLYSAYQYIIIVERDFVHLADSHQ